MRNINIWKEGCAAPCLCMYCTTAKCILTGKPYSEDVLLWLQCDSYSLPVTCRLAIKIFHALSLHPINSLVHLEEEEKNCRLMVKGCSCSCMIDGTRLNCHLSFVVFLFYLWMCFLFLFCKWFLKSCN